MDIRFLTQGAMRHRRSVHGFVQTPETEEVPAFLHHWLVHELQTDGTIEESLQTLMTHLSLSLSLSLSHTHTHTQTSSTSWHRSKTSLTHSLTHSLNASIFSLHCAPKSWELNLKTAISFLFWSVHFSLCVWQDSSGAAFSFLGEFFLCFLQMAS